MISLKILATLFLCFALGACSTRIDNGQKARASVDKALAASDRSIKAALEAAKSLSATSALTAEEALHFTAQGGQPGSVSLRGAFVNVDLSSDPATIGSEPLSPIPQVSVQLIAGKNWRGTTPNINGEQFTLKKELSEKTLQELEKIKDHQTFVNIGCSYNLGPVGGGLDEKAYKVDENGILKVDARVVLLCGDNPVQAMSIFITAEYVILGGFKQNLVGTLGNFFAITAREVILRGENEISTKGKDGSTTVLDGPSVILQAQRVLDTGTLKIQSQGSSYIKSPSEN